MHYLGSKGEDPRGIFGRIQGASNGTDIMKSHGGWLKYLRGIMCGRNSIKSIHEIPGDSSGSHNNCNNAVVTIFTRVEFMRPTL